MSTARKKRPNFTRAPWRCDRPDNENTVRVYDKNSREVLVCEASVGAVIVQAINWCASRGYLP